MRRVRDLQEQRLVAAASAAASSSSSALELLLHALQLLDLLRRRLALELLPRAQVVTCGTSARQRSSPRSSSSNASAAPLRASGRAERARDRLRAARRSITAASLGEPRATCATPSSSTRGADEVGEPRAAAVVRVRDGDAVAGPLEQLDVVLAVAERDRSLAGWTPRRSRGERRAPRPSSRPASASSRKNGIERDDVAAGRRTAPSAAPRAGRAPSRRRRRRASWAAARASRAGRRRRGSAGAWKSAYEARLLRELGDVELVVDVAVDGEARPPRSRRSPRARASSGIGRWRKHVARASVRDDSRPGSRRAARRRLPRARTAAPTGTCGRSTITTRRPASRAACSAASVRGRSVLSSPISVRSRSSASASTSRGKSAGSSISASA